MPAETMTRAAAAQQLSDRLVEIGMRRCAELGLPMQPLGENLIFAGAALLVRSLGVERAVDVLRRAADATEARADCAGEA